METKSELLTIGGVKVRLVKPGIYVREEEWQRYLEFNEVRPVPFARSLHRFADACGSP